jgi:hypothetical protein
MTFVNRDEIAAHGLSMSGRIMQKFWTFSSMRHHNGIFKLVVKKHYCERVVVVLTTTGAGLLVSGYASKSAGVLYQRVRDFFHFEDKPNQKVQFFALARNGWKLSRLRRRSRSC